MKVLKIVYKTKDMNARVLLNHTLYGRLTYKNYRGRKHAYYMQGLLDNIRFNRKETGGECLIFDAINAAELLDTLKIFGEASIEEVDNDFENLDKYTGLEYWSRVAKEKQLPLRIRKRAKHGI